MQGGECYCASAHSVVVPRGGGPIAAPARARRSLGGQRFNTRGYCASSGERGEGSLYERSQNRLIEQKRTRKHLTTEPCFVIAIGDAGTYAMEHKCVRDILVWDWHVFVLIVATNKASEEQQYVCLHSLSTPIGSFCCRDFEARRCPFLIACAGQQWFMICWTASSEIREEALFIIE